MSPHLSVSLRASLSASSGAPCACALQSVSARSGIRAQTVPSLTRTCRRADASVSSGLKSRSRRAGVSCSANQSDASLPAQASAEGAAFKTLQSSFSSLDPDFFSALPRNLQVDLKDAVFDLTNGNVAAECGPAVSASLSALAAALTAADGSPAAAAAAAVARLADAAAKLPPAGRERAVLGRRLRAAGRRFTGMGGYAQGKAAQLGRAMAAAAQAVSVGCADDGASNFDPVRRLQLGPLTVDVTPSKALTGAGVAAAFAVVSWQLAAGLQAVSEDSLAYANDNALTLALSLRGALLALGYGSCMISAFAVVGLLALARELSSQQGGEGGK
ncbi:hypothetical protein CLOM_g4325 [Closterium sp. NIES-68]|nr:hypothetical protein CLOM_g4325 [Closterium sp. NIES-68]GJP75984.1 hypothetical protein CLOP_g6381 [Closterium sp. NIES-67]